MSIIKFKSKSWREAFHFESFLIENPNAQTTQHFPVEHNLQHQNYPAEYQIKSSKREREREFRMCVCAVGKVTSFGKFP